MNEFGRERAVANGVLGAHIHTVPAADTSILGRYDDLIAAFFLSEYGRGADSDAMPAMDAQLLVDGYRRFSHSPLLLLIS